MDVQLEGKEIATKGIVLGNRVCQTNEAKYLCLENLYQKFYRNNFYDIGGTYIEDVADYWFMYKTEAVGNIFLLHLFVSSHSPSSINVSLSFGNELRLDRKQLKATLPSDLKMYKLKCDSTIPHYITTYNFTELDVDMLKDRTLYISVSIDHKDESGNFAIQPEILETIKANHDFSALLYDPVGSDFIIESADGQKFHVHKLLLAAHSEVFKAMLKEDTAESQNNYVKLIDIEAKDLTSFLEFIYTGTIKDLDNTNFFNLFMLADRYNVNGLRELAHYTLSQQLNVDNALEVLIVADMYNSDSLKQATFKFIKRNVSALKSTTFKEIKNADLVRELCEYIVLKP